MTLWTKQELISALEGEFLSYQLSDNLAIDEVVIDSRKTPKSGLFLALKGEKNDAHDFLEQAVTNGCSTLLVQDKSALEKVKNSDFILVKDTFKALYKLAEFSRQRSPAKIIGITGSVGKTSTKEMLKLAFEAYGKTFATYGNLNNHIGLPLSLCNFAADCQFGIFEMGMNHLNEIDPLTRLARPHLAIITNVGPAHIEFFKDEEEIALAKSEIFYGLEKGGVALINRDNRHFEFLKKRAEILGVKILSFGKNSESDFCLEKSVIKDVNSSEILLKVREAGPRREDGVTMWEVSTPTLNLVTPSSRRGPVNAESTSISYQISTSNKAAIYNSVIVAACLKLLTTNSQTGLSQLTKLENPAGRGKAFDVTFNQKTVTIIDDSYNASLLSIASGLEYAAELKSALGKKRVVAALGDMLELGEKSVELHEEIADYLTTFHIDFAILVGEKMTEMAKKLSNNSYKTFLNSSSASLVIEDLLQDGDIIYVKGSRGLKMEKVIEKLTNKTSAH